MCVCACMHVYHMGVCVCVYRFIWLLRDEEPCISLNTYTFVVHSYGGREGHCPWYTLIPMREPLSRRSINRLAPTSVSRWVNLSRRSLYQHVNLPRRAFPDAWTFPDIRLLNAWTPLRTCDFRRAKLFRCVRSLLHRVNYCSVIVVIHSVFVYILIL